MFEIGLLLKVKTETSGVIEYSMTPDSFECSPSCTRCTSTPDTANDTNLAELNKQMHWEPDEVPCSFVATYALDQALLPVMHELNSNVTFTFETLKSQNTAFVSQIYSGSIQSAVFDTSNTSKVFMNPYEKIQPNMVSLNLPVKDVDNMPPVFTNDKNEQIFFLSFQTNIDSCKQNGISIDYRVFDGDLYLNEVVETKFRLFNLRSEVPPEYWRFNEGIFHCTDSMQDSQYILAVEATQVNNPSIRKTTLNGLLSLSQKRLAELSEDSNNINDWKVVCSPNCYLFSSDETIRLRFQVANENTILLSKTPGLLVDHEGYVLVTEEFILFNHTDKLALVACQFDPISRKVTATEELTTGIDLSSIDIEGFVYKLPSDEKLYIGLTFGLIIPLILALAFLMIRYSRTQGSLKINASQTN